MSKTTFSGPVRSQNGFETVDINSSTGAVDNTYYMKRVGRVVVTVSGTSGDNLATWTQPAKSVITQITIICLTAPTVSTGDIGFEVGSTSGGGELVVAIVDEILDGGTTVVIGNVVAPLTLVAQTPSGTTAPASVQYTAAERSVFCNIPTTTTTTTAGTFEFLIDYIEFS